jgi:hypothetical protein
MTRALSNATQTPFQSGFGFSSPGFSVDSAGNIIAASFNIADTDSGIVVDYTFYDSGGFFGTVEGQFDNPELTLERGKSYNIALSLTDFQFWIRQLDTDPEAEEGAQIPYNDGLTHSGGGVGVGAQGKTSGTLKFTVPLNAPDTLYYASASTAGTTVVINIINPTGIFGSLQVTNSTQATGQNTGAVQLAGGMSVAKNISVAGQIKLDGVGIPDLISNTNLNFGAANKVIIKMDGTSIGYIDSDGISAPINSSAITTSTIDNTTIGAITPSTAAFTSASVSTSPLNTTDIANKNYVDLQAISFSIAFGL